MNTAFVHSDTYAQYDLGVSHPLQQGRLIDVKNRLDAYALGVDNLAMFSPIPCLESDLLAVHSRDYIEMVKLASRGFRGPELTTFGLGRGDTPAFDGMWENGILYCGGSKLAAQLVANQSYKVAVNLAGGLHHAHYGYASGFCILSDIAVAIRMLQSQGYPRVLYIDIDAHHGDGVEAFFRSDPSVTTVSFHESGAWLFPGTGDLADRGLGSASDSVWNVPFAPETAGDVWSPTVLGVVHHLIQSVQPDAVVLQCGADAHELDPLTHLRVDDVYWLQTTESILQMVVGLPTIVLGGGGYKRDVVVRLWTALVLQTCGRLADAMVLAIRAEGKKSSDAALGFNRDVLTYLAKIRGLVI